MKCFFAKENGEYSITEFTDHKMRDFDEHITISEYYTVFYKSVGKKNKFFLKFGYEIYGAALVLKNNDDAENVSIEKNFASLVKDILRKDQQKREEFLSFFCGTVIR